MAGPFDDLIQASQPHQPAQASMFADLIPKSDVTPDSVVRSLAQGASFGLADEFAAMMMPHSWRSWSWRICRYLWPTLEQNLAKERGQDKALPNSILM